MSIQSEIDRLQAAKSAIAAALQAMGVEPPQGTTLDQYAAQLTAIAASAPWLPLSGGTMTGDLKIEAHSLFMGPQDSVELKASDTENALEINLGGPGVKFYNTNRLGNLGNPTAATDAVNKGYVDGLVGNINSVLDAINGEVV